MAIWLAARPRLRLGCGSTTARCTRPFEVSSSTPLAPPDDIRRTFQTTELPDTTPNSALPPGRRRVSVRVPSAERSRVVVTTFETGAGVSTSDRYGPPPAGRHQK